MAVALAPGYGVGWAELDPDADQPDAEIIAATRASDPGAAVRPARPARQGVVVSVSAIHRAVVPDSPGRGRIRIRLASASKVRPTGGLASTTCLPGPSRRPPTPTDGSPCVASAVASRPQLSIIDPRFALQTIEVETDGSSDAKSVTMASATGPDRHRSRDLRRHRQARSACPGRRSVPWAMGNEGPGRLTSRPMPTGGSARIPPPGDVFNVSAAPPAGQLYLAASKRVEWPKGAIEHSVDLSLPRGVVDPR